MVAYDAVLVPTDGSESNDAVLDHALALAKDHEATLHALFVTDRRLSLAADDDEDAAVRESLEERGDAAVAAVADRAREAGVDAVTAIREGVPDREILEYAADAGADVVVMGTHGRTGRERITHLGSVAERVVTDAPIPVFVVPVAGGEA